MATISEAISAVLKLGCNDIRSFRMESNETTYHKVNHKYRETIIAPYISVQNNISFMIGKGQKHIIFADNTTAKVIDVKEKHICELENDIKEQYNCDPWTFIRKWYASYKDMDSMTFLVIKTKKEE